MGDGVLIGPNAIPILIAVAVCGALGYWLSRSGQSRRTPSTLAMLWQALTWRFTPALRSWAEASKEKAVSHYAYDMSSTDEWEEEEDADDDVAATTATTQQQPIAIQQNERNALLLHAKAEALAAMVEAGIVTETKGLQIVFNVRPSSTNPRYIEARAALHAELAKRRTPIAGRPTPATFASDAPPR